MSVTTIQPDGIYDDSVLVLGLGVSLATLVRARREGHLRFCRKGNRVLYRGQWLLDWLDRGAADVVPASREEVIA